MVDMMLTHLACLRRRHVATVTGGFYGLIMLNFPFNPPFPTIGEPALPACRAQQCSSPFPCCLMHPHRRLSLTCACACGVLQECAPAVSSGPDKSSRPSYHHHRSLGGWSLNQSR